MLRTNPCTFKRAAAQWGLTGKPCTAAKLIVNVRTGSLPDIAAALPNVCFTSKRTSPNTFVMSAKCQKQKSRLGNPAQRPTEFSATPRHVPLTALMQFAAPHQALGDVGCLQRRAFGRRVGREITGNRDEDVPALVSIAPCGELPDSSL
jgi:hypothetical protein